LRTTAAANMPGMMLPYSVVHGGQSESGSRLLHQILTVFAKSMWYNLSLSHAWLSQGCCAEGRP
jgi:hypothetical protein